MSKPFQPISFLKNWKNQQTLGWPYLVQGPYFMMSHTHQEFVCFMILGPSNLPTIKINPINEVLGIQPFKNTKQKILKNYVNNKNLSLPPFHTSPFSQK